jgi:uncharacterized protein YgiM (DUF1202 family)
MKHTTNKMLFISITLSLALACTLSSPTSNSLQAEPTAAQGSTVITETSSPTSEAIPIQTPTADSCNVNTGIEGGTVNLRSCAGTDCSVLAIVTEGERLDILTAGLWTQATNADGVTGWINSVYCKGK